MGEEHRSASKTKLCHHISLPVYLRKKTQSNVGSEVSPLFILNLRSATTSRSFDKYFL